MFATLLGPLPRPPLPEDADPEAILDAVLTVQVEHGLEPVTDGGWPLVPDDPVASWRAAAARAPHLVKAVVTGPFSARSDGTRERGTIQALADAGCAWIEVHEPAAIGIGDDAAARDRFAALHESLTHGLDGVHLGLAITGGDADAAGIETILAGAYASLAVDLVAGPDNWRLVVAAPGDRGIVCGVVAPKADSDDGPELMLWAAGYAASTGGRGSARVGLATAASFAHLPWAVAAAKVGRLGEATRLATAPREERAAALDPRAIDIRSAAMGRFAPGTRRPGKIRRTGPPKP